MRCSYRDVVCASDGCRGGSARGVLFADARARRAAAHRGSRTGAAADGQRGRGHWPARNRPAPLPTAPGRLAGVLRGAHGPGRRRLQESPFRRRRAVVSRRLGARRETGRPPPGAALARPRDIGGRAVGIGAAELPATHRDARAGIAARSRVGFQRHWPHKAARRRPRWRCRRHAAGGPASAQRADVRRESQPRPGNARRTAARNRPAAARPQRGAERPGRACRSAGRGTDGSQSGGAVPRRPQRRRREQRFRPASSLGALWQPCPRHPASSRHDAAPNRRRPCNG